MVIETTLIALLTFLVLLFFIGLTDIFLQRFFGQQPSWPKALLVVFTFLSLLYQAGFLLHLPFLFSFIDGAALLLCLLFHKTIFKEMKRYGEALFVKPWGGGYRGLFLLYPLFFYLFVLALFSVPGWNWDSMIHSLSRPFLFLNEKTVFTPFYSDVRQVAWPMGGDVLTYLFTRHGETVGVGLPAFLFYIGSLILVFHPLASETDKKTSVTLTFVAASFPLMVYGATSDKTDLLVAFAFLMMWQSYFKREFFFLFLSLAFGLSLKLSFAVFGSLSLAAFILLEVFENRRDFFGKKTRYSLQILLPMSILFLFLSQIHLYFYNWLTNGHLFIDQAYLHDGGANAPLGGAAFLQNFIKQQLLFADFVLPLSSAGFPFFDTWISSFYNKTVGALTRDLPWNYSYFPQEMSAACGPFGLLVLWKIYASCLKESKRGPKALSFVSLSGMLYFAYTLVWQPVSVIRYFLPLVLACFTFLPAVRRSRVFQRHTLIRGLCLSLLFFCLTANYAKPLVAYHPKAIPWHRYAFTDRKFLYSHKYFLDDRMAVYRENAGKGKRIFVFTGEWSTWIFPYYEYAPDAFVRVTDYRFKRPIWSREDFNGYDLVVCNGLQCIQEWDSNSRFRRIWKSSPDAEKQAAFYQRRGNAHE